jgi:hypothetical protein
MSGAVTSLLSAVVGGVLVLLGDGVRRRAERRAEDRRRFFEASVALASTFNRIAGALADGHSRGLPRTDALLPSTKRYEVQTRFWSTPGAAALSVEASKLSTTWTVLVDNYESEDDWKDVYTAHIQALRRFESAVLRHMGDTTPLPD